MNKKGQALVEFVLILPIVIFIIMIILDFGNIIYQKNHLENTLANVVSLYDNKYSIEQIKDKLSLNKEQISIHYENKTITLTKKIDIVTPGLNYVINNPYEITTSRSITHE